MVRVAPQGGVMNKEELGPLVSDDGSDARLMRRRALGKDRS
jgi:hypothetical protein